MTISFDDPGVDAGDRAADPSHRVVYDPAAGRVGVAGAQRVQHKAAEEVAAAEHDNGEQRRQRRRSATRRAGQRRGNVQPLPHQEEQHQGAGDLPDPQGQHPDLSWGGVVNGVQYGAYRVEGVGDAGGEEAEVAADDHGQGGAGVQPAFAGIGLCHSRPGSRGNAQPTHPTLPTAGPTLQHVGARVGNPVRGVHRGSLSSGTDSNLVVIATAMGRAFA